MKNGYPVNLRLHDKRVVVVGGGRVAERKISSLLIAQARVDVISPMITKRIEQWVQDQCVTWRPRLYHPGDISGYALVIAATSISEVNLAVQKEADGHGIWYNIVDHPELSNFIIPAVVRRGRLTLTVSTEGASPTLAQQITQDWENRYGQEYEIYLDFLYECRVLILQYVTDEHVRQFIFKQMIQLDIWVKIRDGSFLVWKEDLLRTVKRDPCLAQVAPFLTS